MWLFSTRLLAQRPTSCLSVLVSWVWASDRPALNSLPTGALALTEPLPPLRALYLKRTTFEELRRVPQSTADIARRAQPISTSVICEDKTPAALVPMARRAEHPS